MCVRVRVCVHVCAYPCKCMPKCGSALTLLAQAGQAGMGKALRGAGERKLVGVFGAGGRREGPGLCTSSPQNHCGPQAC